jgi:phosphate:Na+ symporter
VVGPLLHGTGLGGDDQTALVLFHTGFNVMGTAMFLPFTAAFAAAMERLVPATAPQLAGALDANLMADPDSALDAAARTADAIRGAAAQALAAALGPARDLRPLAALAAQAEPAMAALEDWLTRLRLPADHAKGQARRAALMHLTDHLSRLLARAAEADRIGTIAAEPALRRPGAALAGAMAAASDPARMDRLADLVQARARRHRRATLLAEHAGILTVAEVFRQTDAMRWLERVAEHAERMAHYADAARADPARD